VLLARAGATADRRALDGPLGVTAVLGAAWPGLDADSLAGDTSVPPAGPAIAGNWIKLHPSCLGTHAPIEAAAAARRNGYRSDGTGLEVRVGAVARQAAHLDAVSDGLSAKFSIPYCVARTLRAGPPGVADFAHVEPEAQAGAARVAVVVDEDLPPFGAVLTAGGTELARVLWPRGAPEQPVSVDELADKVGELAGGALAGILDDPDAPASGVLDAAGLR
jgi:2-methylcitrate dehydratase PrpD